MPVNVARVNVTQQLADGLELSWEEVKGSNLSYILRRGGGAETPVAVLENAPVIRHTISSLSPRTKYSFTLYTVFEGVKSRGLTFTSVTGSNCLFNYVFIYSCLNSRMNSFIRKVHEYSVICCRCQYLNTEINAQLTVIVELQQVVKVIRCQNM